MKLRYSAMSDVGRVRRDNQDSGYAGPHLLVVADGVGGSARGDIASSATVEVLRQLDNDPSDDILSALAGAIHRSHDRIAELVAESPEIEGTSTTVTAAIFDGTLLGIGHVGDSRGYLLRGGTLSRLTEDHTFVQSLIDEGRITEDEARVHPHRNLILRAVDGVHEPEPDAFMLEVEIGDRLLLCSDGCAGVLTDEDLARLLGEGTPDSAAVDLIRASLEAGSTDNVTVVVADLVDDHASEDGSEQSGTSAAAAMGPLIVGAAAEASRRRRMSSGRSGAANDTGELEPVEAGPTSGPTSGAAPAAALAADLDPEEARYAPRAPRRFLWARRLAGLAIIALLVAIVAVAGYKWSQNQFYVAGDAEQVAIFRGVEADLPGLQLHRVEERSTLALDALPTYNARQVREGINASSLNDARGIVQRLERLAMCPDSPPTPEASPTPKSSPTSKTRAQAQAQKDAAASAKASPGPSASPSPSDASPDCTEKP